MTSGWRPTRTQLKYRLGEYTLFTAAFDGVTCNQHFTELRTDEPPAPPFAVNARDAADVCVIWSQPVSKTLEKLTVADGWIRYVPRQYKRYYVDLQGSFENYLKRFSSKTRSTLVRKVRKFTEASGGAIDMREFRSPEDLDIFFAMAQEVSSKTYQERLLDSGLPKDGDFRSNARQAAARGEVRAYLLFLSGRPVAYIYCPVHAGILLYEYVGFDPDHQSLSPGTVLQYLTLKRLFDEGGYRMFDFTEGEGPHKALFATDSIYCADIYLYRHRVLNAAAVRAHLTVGYLSDGIAEALDWLGLKKAIKRMLRTAA